MSVISTVVVADTGMVAAYDEVRATVVLAHQRVEDGFARAGVAHGGRQHAQNHALARIVVFQQHLVAAHAYSGGDVVALRVTDQRVQVEAIDRLQRAFLDVFMGAVNRIARLEGDNTLPTTLGEQPTRLRGRVAINSELLRLQGDDTHGATQQHLTLLIQYADTRMGLVFRAIDLTRLKLLVVAILFLDAQHSLWFAITVDQCYLLTLAQLCCLFGGDGQRNRDRPGQAVGEMHLVDNTEVVVAAHEAT